jgi:hypothetical protein
VDHGFTTEAQRTQREVKEMKEVRSQKAEVRKQK